MCWFVWSPDLSYLDFYFLGHMKILAYDTPVENAKELMARIALASGKNSRYARMFRFPCAGDVR